MMRAPLSAIPENATNTTSNRHVHEDALLKKVNWCGASGTYYPMTEESISLFTLKESNLYLIVKDDASLWVGTASEIIDDQVSRADFRTALRAGSAVLHMKAPTDDVDCMMIKWDLYEGHRAGALALVP